MDTDNGISGFFKAGIATKNHERMPFQLYLCIILYMEQHPWALDCSQSGVSDKEFDCPFSPVTKGRNRGLLIFGVLIILQLLMLN